MRAIGRIYTVVPPAFDRRRTPHRPTRHIGQILTEPTAAPQHCLVIQESDGGVRIQTTGACQRELGAPVSIRGRASRPR